MAAFRGNATPARALGVRELGLDSLDLVQMRNGFQKAFKLTVPLATFTNAQQTLGELISKLGELISKLSEINY